MNHSRFEKSSELRKKKLIIIGQIKKKIQKKRQKKDKDGKMLPKSWSFLNNTAFFKMSILFFMKENDRILNRSFQWSNSYFTYYFFSFVQKLKTHKHRAKLMVCIRCVMLWESWKFCARRCLVWKQWANIGWREREKQKKNYMLSIQLQMGAQMVLCRQRGRWFSVIVVNGFLILYTQ